jgi:hypothetical protein
VSSCVWIGDLIAAWSAVGRRPDEFGAIVTLLGLDPPVLDETTIGAAPPSLTSRTVTPLPPRMPMPVPIIPQGPADPPKSGDAPSKRVRSIVVEPLAPETTRPPIWSGPTLRQAPPDVIPGKLQPLFPFATARALLGAAAHSVRDGDRLDLDEAVRVVAQRRPIRDLPRATSRTLRAGIQLVIDRTWAMRPFFDDIAVLRRQLFTVVGRDLIDEMWFFGELDQCRRPRRIGHRALPGPDVAWRPPQGGIPVIVVTDFGRADELNDVRRTAMEWKELVARAQMAGCDVVTIVPRRLAKSDRDARMSSIAWDTRTSVGRVLAERERSRG